MERIIKLKLQLLDKCKMFYEWLQESPLNILIALICLSTIIEIAILLKPILLYLLMVGFALIIFNNEIKKFFSRIFGKRILPNLEDDEICFETTRFMHGAICEGKSLDEVTKTSSSVHSIYDNNDYRELYNSVNMLKLRLIRKNRDKDPDCYYLKIALQDSVSARLADGYLQGYSWAIPKNNTIPLIKVATLDYSDLYIYIGILLTNSVESVNAARISDTPTLPKAIDDIDPLFAKEDEEKEGGLNNAYTILT